MAKGLIRQAIEDWASEALPPEGGPGWWERVKARWDEFSEWVNEYKARATPAELRAAPPSGVEHIIYALTGSQAIRERYEALVSGESDTDISEQLANMLRGIFSNPGAKEIAETLGTVVTEPVLTLFEQYAGRDDVDPKEFARAFHGLMIGLNISGGLADTLFETATGGQVEGVGRLLQSVYWSLGLGFLGWQTLAPLLSSGLQPGLERYYRKLYRPNRFSASDLRDLYALGKISRAQLEEEARFLGWRDGDVNQWIELAFRTLTQGDVWQALHEGYISEDEATIRLRVLGYDPDDIPLLFKLNPKPQTSDVKDFTASTARQGYRERILSETDLRGILSDLKYSTREIDVIVSLEDLKISNDQKSLTLSQLKAAWTENIITDAEVTHWLAEEGFGSEEAGLLLETWKAELEPVFRKLNIGTITAAYVEAIIDRVSAKNKLMAVGLTDEDATLTLNLTEARNPDAFGAAPPPLPRELTPGTLSQLVVAGLLTPEDMKARLLDLNFTEADADLLSEAARLRAGGADRQLPQRSIERAYLAGVIDRDTSAALLIDLGFTTETANIILDTVENENPEVFSANPEDRLKQLTPGVLEDLVIAGLITPEEMNARLVDLGYSEADAALLTERAVQFTQEPVRVLNQSIIERAYLVGVLDRAGALAKLESIDFSPEDATQILDTVEAEHPEIFAPELVQSLRLPSISALAVATYDGIITVDEYFARAQELGYRVQDAEMYLSLAGSTGIKSARTLTAAQVVNAYGAGLVPRGEGLARLHAQGYNDVDATLLLRMEKDFIELTDTWDQLLAGNLDPFAAIAQLVSAEYSDEDIVNAFAALPASDLVAMGINLTDLQQALAITPGGA
jgi:hypothetical protein